MVEMRIFHCRDHAFGGQVSEFANHIEQRPLAINEFGECGTRFINGDIGRLLDHDCRKPAVEEILLKKVRIDGDMYSVDPEDYMLER